MPSTALLLGLEWSSRNCKVLLVVQSSGPEKHDGASMSTVTSEKEGCGCSGWRMHALPVFVWLPTHASLVNWQL